MVKRVLRLPAVLDRTGFASKTSVYTGVAAGTFPAPIPLGPRSVGWLESDIDTWIDQQAAKSVPPKHAGKPPQKSRKRRSTSQSTGG